MKTIIILLFMVFAWTCASAQALPKSELKWPLPDKLPRRKSHPGDRFLNNLQVLTGRVTIEGVDDKSKFSSSGKMLIFQNTRCLRCIYVVTVGENDTYEVMVLPGTYRVIYDTGDTRRPYDGLAPTQPRTVRVNKTSAHSSTFFDVALRLY